MAYKRVVLIILDGWGIGAEDAGNAIYLANKPFWNKISTVYPHTRLQAAGEAVGLPSGEAGNSEVGHLNIGAGMIVYQEFPRVNMALTDGSFLTNRALLTATGAVKKNQSTLHLMGLIGTGNVHSSIEHLYALLWFAKAQGIQKVAVHTFTDGRDSSPTAGLGLVEIILEKFKEIGVGSFASLSGRYFAMDRDNHWERIQKVYSAIVEGNAPKANDPIMLVNNSYKKKVTDEFIEPTLIVTDGSEPQLIRDGDGVIFFNFRPDRALQMTKAFVEKDFKGFERKKFLPNLTFVTMTEYEKNLPVLVAFPPIIIDNPLAAVISLNDLRQLHIGETEKYAHVTYFINGGRETPYPNEERIHVPSPKVATYDQKPEMSAVEITDQVCNFLRKGLYDFYLINFANADMVAHTGSLEATKKAIEVLDACLERIVKVALPSGAVVITADHGNAESLVNPKTGGVDTEHSANTVPFVVVAEGFNNRTQIRLPSGILADVAPTVLGLLGIHPPSSMTGKNLLG